MRAMLALCLLACLAGCASPTPPEPPAPASPSIDWNGEVLSYDGGIAFAYRPPAAFVFLGEMTDGLAGVGNRIFAFEGPDGETVRLMFVAGQDWDMALAGPAPPDEYAFCPPAMRALAGAAGHEAHCFLFMRGCTLARVHTVQLDPSWRLFLEYAESVEPMGRPCRDWRDAAALDDAQRAFALLFMRRADMALRTDPAPLP